MNVEKIADDLVATLHEYVARALEIIQERLERLEARPAPKDGASVTIADVEPMLKQMVDALPPAEPGKSITVGEVIEAIEPRVESAIAKAVLDVERRAQGVLERAVERMPKPKDGKDGKDGVDGFSLDDLQIEDDGEGTVTLRFMRGELVRERTFRVPSFSDRGVFREGDAYRKGDGVTFGGSFWIAQKDAPEGKPGTSPDWRLAVKKGRDGRDSEK